MLFPHQQYLLPLLLLLSLTASAQQAEKKFHFSFAIAHPSAKPLMKDNFFWSEIEEEAPFGSDAGSDAAYGFYKWRKEYRSGSPVTYLKELFASWNYPQMAWDELDTTKIKLFMATPAHPDPATVEQTVLAIKQNQENTPLPPGKHKLALEGKIDPAMKNYAQIAIKREMLSVVTRNFGSQGQQNAHNEKLAKLQKAIRQAP